MAKTIKHRGGLKASDDLCTRACKRSRAARLDRQRNLYSRVMAQNRLTTYIPAEVSYLAEHETIYAEAPLDRLQNSFMRVEAPNRLANHIPAEASDVLCTTDDLCTS